MVQRDIIACVEKTRCNQLRAGHRFVLLHICLPVIRRGMCISTTTSNSEFSLGLSKHSNTYCLFGETISNLRARKIRSFMTCLEHVNVVVKLQLASWMRAPPCHPPSLIASSDHACRCTSTHRTGREPRRRVQRAQEASKTNRGGRR